MSVIPRGQKLAHKPLRLTWHVKNAGSLLLDTPCLGVDHGQGILSPGEQQRMLSLVEAAWENFGQQQHPAKKELPLSLSSFSMLIECCFIILHVTS